MKVCLWFHLAEINMIAYSVLTNTIQLTETEPK